MPSVTIVITALTPISDRPLNDSTQWNANYQSATTVGKFDGLAYTQDHSAVLVTVNDVTDFGWGDGTHGTLGDSHAVDFFNFRLAVQSIVFGLAGLGVVDPARAV